MSRETDIKEKVSSINGWLDIDEACLLYDMAANADGDIIEIGSWQGRSTAALALGAASGKKASVWAVDPFIGTQSHPRKTNHDTLPVGNECSPQMLRENLDRVGVNGSVKIIAKPSQDAAGDVPDQCSLLWIDGDHAYDAVCRDFDLYLPKVKVGGFVVIHDVCSLDPGVVKAIDHKIAGLPNQWRMIDQVNKAMVLRRVETPSHNVQLMCPGVPMGWGPVTGIVQASLGAHTVGLVNNNNGWDDFNALWAQVLNTFESGQCTHVAMLHSDIAPQAGWVDILIDEMEELKLDFLSVACSMKDDRAICNCGIGREDNRWGAWRRLAVKELPKLPPTFNLSDLKRHGFCGPASGHGDKVLLHNTGCFVADLRCQAFWQQYTTSGVERGDNHKHDEDDLFAWFNFPTKVCRDKASGRWVNQRESEDWFFSRQLHKLKARTAITRKVSLTHVGFKGFPNSGDWGKQDHDEDTRKHWMPEPITEQPTETKP